MIPATNSTQSPIIVPFRLTKGMVFIMLNIISFFIFSIFILLLSSESHAADETVYVQSAQTNLKSEPKVDSANVKPLKRGDALTVIKKEGIWYQAKSGDKTGWVSKMFVNTHAPVGASDLSKQGDLAKTSRRRSSEYGVTAATRGLSAGNRTRQGREEFQKDEAGLAELEKQQISPTDLKDFQKKGNLKGE